MQLQQLQAEGKEIDEETIRTVAAAAMARKRARATKAAAVEDGLVVVDGGNSLDSPASIDSHFTSLPVQGQRPAKR